MWPALSRLCGQIVPGLVRNGRYCVATSVYSARYRLASTSAGDQTTPGTSGNTEEVKSVGNGAQSKALGAVQMETSTDGRFVTLKTDGNDVGRFYAIWLRHNCQCPGCRQRFSGQKLVRPADLATSYSVQWAGVDPDDRLVYIDWNEEDHRSEFSVSFLRHSVHTPAERRRVTSTPSGGVGWLPTVNFEEILQPPGRLRWLQMIAEVGVVLLRGVPTDAAMVRLVAELVAPVQHTIYGETWDVLADPKPINVAYSTAELDFHMDLSYYESPPGIQFLHCVRFDDCVKGGESVFVDAWYVAEMLRATYPEYFNTLTRVPATFQKIHFDREYPVYMRYFNRSPILKTFGKENIGLHHDVNCYTCRPRPKSLRVGLIIRPIAIA